MCIYIYSPPSQMMLFHTAYTTKRQISARPCLDLLAPLIRDGHVLIEGCMGYLWPKKMTGIYGYMEYLWIFMANKHEYKWFFFRMAWGLVLLEVYLAMHPKGTPSKTQQILK